MEKQGRMDEALQVFQRAMIWQKYNATNQYPILYFSFADFYMKTNNNKDAKLIIDQALQLFGQNKEILSAIFENYNKILSKKELADIEKKIKDIEAEEQRKKIEAEGSAPDLINK